MLVKVVDIDTQDLITLVKDMSAVFMIGDDVKIKTGGESTKKVAGTIENIRFELESWGDTSDVTQIVEVKITG